MMFSSSKSFNRKGFITKHSAIRIWMIWAYFAKKICDRLFYPVWSLCINFTCWYKFVTGWIIESDILFKGDQKEIDETGLWKNCSINKKEKGSNGIFFPGPKWDSLVRPPESNQCFKYAQEGEIPQGIAVNLN
jgi:hypothetical protein